MLNRFYIGLYRFCISVYKHLHVTYVEALVQCHSAWDFALVCLSAGWPGLALACASLAAWAGKLHYGYVHLFALHSLALCLSPAVRVLLWPSWPSGMHSSALLSPMSLDSDPNVVVQCPLLSLSLQLKYDASMAPPPCLPIPPFGI